MALVGCHLLARTKENRVLVRGFTDWIQIRKAIQLLLLSPLPADATFSPTFHQVLTAAHCTRDSKQRPFAARQFTVRLGDVDLSSDHEPSAPVTFKVADIRAHPRFSRVGFYNDIASNCLQFTFALRFLNALNFSNGSRAAGEEIKICDTGVPSNTANAQRKVNRKASDDCRMGNNLLRRQGVSHTATSESAHLEKRRL